MKTRSTNRRRSLNTSPAAIAAVSESMEARQLLSADFPVSEVLASDAEQSAEETSGQNLAAISNAASRIASVAQSGTQSRLVTPRGRISDQSPQFTWTAVPGAVRYEIWVQNRQSNQGVLHSDQLTGTSATPNTRLPAGTYQWWIRAYDRAGRQGAWSRPATFRISAGSNTGGGDDRFENNDSINQSTDLGNLTQTTRVTNRSLADGEDWYTFTMNGTGTLQDYVQLAFNHSRGDIDLKRSVLITPADSVCVHQIRWPVQLPLLPAPW